MMSIGKVKKEAVYKIDPKTNKAKIVPVKKVHINVVADHRVCEGSVISKLGK